MGDLTKTQLESLIKDNLGGRTDRDSTLYLYLNMAQQRIARLRTFREMRETIEFSTVASTRGVTLSYWLREIYSVRIINSAQSSRLIFLPTGAMDTKAPYAEATGTGQPSHYSYWGKTFEFWRIPDAAYTVRARVYLWPTPFTAGADTISTLSVKDDVIIAFATAQIYRSLGELTKQKVWEDEGLKLLAESFTSDSPSADAMEGHAEWQEASNSPVPSYLDPFSKR